MRHCKKGIFLVNNVNNLKRGFEDKVEEEKGISGRKGKRASGDVRKIPAVYPSLVYLYTIHLAHLVSQRSCIFWQIQQHRQRQNKPLTALVSGAVLNARTPYP